MRVVIGEDEALFREGLRLVLADLGVDVVAATGDAHQLLGLCHDHQPDLMLTDIRMPPQLRDDGLQAAISVRAAIPGQPVFVLSQHVQHHYALMLLDTGADGIGYLLKQRVSDLRQFHTDLTTVAGGGTVVDPDLVRAAAPRKTATGLGLTARQLEVLQLIAQGRSNAAIAASLYISERTVKLHIASIFETLGLAEDPDDHRRVLAVVRYLTT